MLRSEIILGCALLSACASDPVREQAIDDLGPEAPGVHPGPLHRPNQPCLLCHDGSGPGNAIFSLAGTIYAEQKSLTPLPNAIVHFVDSKKRHYQTATNCAGNFFVDPDDFSPAFPVWMSIQFGNFIDPISKTPKPLVIPMSSPSFREGSCAKCHRDPASGDSVGHIFLEPVLPAPLPPSGCP